MKQRALAPLLVVVMVLGTLHLTAYSTPTLDITSDQLATETPVYIDGDTNFTATASARGWSGTGASDDPIMIDGIEIQGSGVETLVSIQNTALYFIIENSSFNNSQLAIYVNFSPNGIIRQNTITHAGDGMIIASSQNTTVSRNDISLVNNRGIYFDRSDDGSITDNIIDGGIEGITLNRADNNTVASNTVSNAWDYGIVSSLSSYNNISHNEVFDNRYGIFLTDPFRTLIDSNTAHHNELGIYGTDSRSNLFSNNIVYENIDGLHVDRQDLTLTERSNITGTLAYDNIESGIKVSFGEGMHIRDNEMYGNGRGFETFFGLEHHVFDNNIHDNDVGMYLDSPENHNITGHNLINNGFHIAYYLDNLIYHKLNSLGDNTVNGLPVYYLNHSTGVSITGDFGQILLVNVSNSDIGGVTINNSSAAVFLADSANTTISQSNFTGNHAGVGVYRSDGTSIKDVRVTNGTYGIEIVESSDVKVNSSDLFANKNGLVADMADDLVLFENNIHHNREDGVRIQQSSNIVVTGNIIAYNGYLSPYPVNTYGIQLNSFIETDLKDSGMYVIFGLNNLISKNSFLYNQGFGVHSEGLATVEENDFVENSNHPNATRLPCEFECGEIFGNDGNFGNNFFSTYQGLGEDQEGDGLYDDGYGYTCGFDFENNPQTCTAGAATEPYGSQHWLSDPVISTVTVNGASAQLQVSWTGSIDSQHHDIEYKVAVTFDTYDLDDADRDEDGFFSARTTGTTLTVGTANLQTDDYKVQIIAYGSEGLIAVSQPVDVVINNEGYTSSTTSSSETSETSETSSTSTVESSTEPTTTSSVVSQLTTNTRDTPQLFPVFFIILFTSIVAFRRKREL